MTQSRTHNCNELRLSNAGEKVTLVGWYENLRKVSKNLGFLILRDFYGTTQIVVETEEMMEKFPDIQLLFIESGGDNLSATFSPELVDATIFVIDVAEGDKIPRKGGPGITKSDLLVINKIDLAPYVGADLSVMERDSKKMRGERPFLFTNIRGLDGTDAVIDWIKKNVLLEGC